jgi:hypothetical protein
MALVRQRELLFDVSYFFTHVIPDIWNLIGLERIFGNKVTIDSPGLE